MENRGKEKSQTLISQITLMIKKEIRKDIWPQIAQMNTDLKKYRKKEKGRYANKEQNAPGRTGKKKPRG